MSQTPIFDALYEEFLEAHRWTPVLATMPDPSEFIEMQQEHTQEIPVVVDPAPSQREIVVEETDEEWEAAASEPQETFEERIGREIREHIATYTPIKLDIPSWMTEDESPVYAQPMKTPFPGWADLISEHQNNILNPPMMPTREQLGLTENQEDDDPAEESEEPQHVFPLTREDGRRKFLQMPTVARIRDIMQNVVYEPVA